MIPTLLLTLLVKSGLIAGAGLLASRIGGLRPTDRVDILRATTVLLLALPVVMALAPSLDLAVLPANEAAPEPLPMWSGEVVSMGGVAVSGSMPWPSASMLLLAAWAVGVAALALRLALGLHMLSRWTETGTPIDNPGWSRPLQRLAPRHAPRLISTDRIDGPLSWGTTPGVILIDRASLSAPETAPAVIAHELGHLKRRDWVFLILSRLAVALFWFNPLVWRLRSELSARSEETADAEALRTIDRQTYARTLVRLAAHPSPLVATAMAADARSLKKRIACIMSDLPPSRRRPLTVALTLAGLAAVATPLAALELHNRTAPAAAPAVASAASPALAATLAVAPAAPQTVSRSQTVIRTDGVTYISVPDAEPLPASSSNVIYLRAADMPEAPVPPAPPAPPPPPAFVHAFAPPAPPAPPSFAVPPAPPAPPPPPAPYSASYQGGYHVLSSRPATPEERRMADTARAEADVARRQATEARRVAADVRRDAERVRLDAGREQARADQARVHAEAARTGADRARAAADVARQQATRQMAEGRVQMGRGAEEMHRGADQMRRESVKLRDPAYRAEQIARSRAQGRTVTDKELCDLSPRLATQAAELDRRADELAARARATQ